MLILVILKKMAMDLKLFYCEIHLDKFESKQNINKVKLQQRPVQSI